MTESQSPVAGTKHSLTVLHLAGSAVDDFYADLSRVYAADCLHATEDPDRYCVQRAWVSPDGSWRFPRDFSVKAVAAAPALTFAEAVAHLITLAVDVVVPQMFCRPGMTTYRALFDLLQIPLVGNTATAMALAADKSLARAVVAAAGVAIPAGEVIRRGQHPSVALPMVVKPVDTDNSLGLTLVRTQAELGPALEVAFGHAEQVLVEAYVPLGREVRCAILERGDELVCLPLEEYAVDETTKPIRLTDDKVRMDDAVRVGDVQELALVAKTADYAWIVELSDPITTAVHAAARTAHRALGCRDYSLFDFRIDPEGGVWFLEAGLYCSFARQSVIAVMAEAAGIGLEDLFQMAVLTATQDGRAGHHPGPAGPSRDGTRPTVRG